MRTFLPDLVTGQAEVRPDALALVMGRESLTYGQLEELSNQLARALLEAGCRKGDRVCLFMPKSPAAILSMLGVMKAGCTYVPVDPAGPTPRVAKIMESCGSRLVLAAGPVAAMLEELLAGKGPPPPFAVGWLGRDKVTGGALEPRFCWDDLPGSPGGPLGSRVSPEDPAHILFTSGSTGTPKGVMITHANVLHFVRWAVKYFGMGPADRTSGHSPLHFDLSTFDIYGTFAAGARLHLVPPELNLLAPKLAGFIRDYELTQWFSVPSILNYLAKFDVVKENDFPALKRLLWCGEVFPTPALIYWMKRLPRVSFTNLYGPTEATIASSYYPVPACPEDEKAPVPIGTACEGEELLVLDDDLRPAPPGEAGSLYIGGVGLSPGYWNDPEKTRAVFLPDPRGRGPGARVYRTGDLARVGPDGLVYYLGRADSQIKSRGYRIELGEIEAALNSLGLLRESAMVAVNTDGFEGATICCAYVPGEGAAVTPGGLRKELSRLVPQYMLPSRWMPFEKLPQNANGKIDRRKLKEFFQENEAPAR